MFDLIDLGMRNDDHCYEVSFHDSYTVKDFINEILEKYPKDYGTIEIPDSYSNTLYACFYECGDITGDYDIKYTDKIFNETIKRVLVTKQSGAGKNYTIMI